MSQPFPWIRQAQAIVVLRVTTALLFMAHAIVRLINGTIPQFGGAMEARGLPAGELLVWGITLFETVGGALLVAGYFTRWLAGGFIVLLLAGIALIHYRLGWFVGEHGSGGSEYSVALIAALVVIAAADGERALG
jgi:putative oxidoreductase